MRVGVKNNVKFTKTDTLALKGIAICMMLFHHLFAFPERIPVGLNIVDISVGGYDLSYIIAAFCKMCVAVYIYLGGGMEHFSRFTVQQIERKNSDKKL